MYANSSTWDGLKPVMFTKDIPKNSGKNILLVTWTVFPRLHKVNVFPPQRPYYTPANEVAGVYSDPYVRTFVRPSQSLLL